MAFAASGRPGTAQGTDGPAARVNLPSRTFVALMDPFVCKRCAGLGPTCCQLTPGTEESCFPLSVLEKDRIREAAPQLGAFALSPNSSAFISYMERLFPKEKELVRELFPERKEHFRLATDPEGRCKLLGLEGCLLPVESRPYYCRIFPFWVNGGRLSVFAVESCVAFKEARALAGLLSSLGVSQAKVRELYGRLRLAWGLPPREGLPMVPAAFARQCK